MTTLIIGASGATGRPLAARLLRRGHSVKAVVRSAASPPDSIRRHDLASVVVARVPDLGDAEMAEHVRGCRAVASCPGRNMTFKGLFGPPRRLVTDATRRFCDAIRATGPADPVKFVLMNTAGNRNRDLDERISLAKRVVVGLLRLSPPPHADNEAATDYLRRAVGRTDPSIEWGAVRPDGLVDEAEVKGYDVHRSPTRSAIFDAGATSRINVAEFMAELIDDDSLWRQWKGETPVIYNQASA